MDYVDVRRGVTMFLPGKCILNAVRHCNCMLQRFSISVEFIQACPSRKENRTDGLKQTPLCYFVCEVPYTDVYCGLCFSQD